MRVAKEKNIRNKVGGYARGGGERGEKGFRGRGERGVGGKKKKRKKKKQKKKQQAKAEGKIGCDGGGE
mgnify:CR=1 FL=1